MVKADVSDELVVPTVKGAAELAAVEADDAAAAGVADINGETLPLAEVPRASGDASETPPVVVAVRDGTVDDPVTESVGGGNEGSVVVEPTDARLSMETSSVGIRVPVVPPPITPRYRWTSETFAATAPLSAASLQAPVHWNTRQSATCPQRAAQLARDGAGDCTSQAAGGGLETSSNRAEATARSSARPGRKTSVKSSGRTSGRTSVEICGTL